jgi:hypothetical protein
VFTATRLLRKTLSYRRWKLKGSTGPAETENTESKDESEPAE